MEFGGLTRSSSLSRVEASFLRCFTALADELPRKARASSRMASTCGAVQ